MLEMIQSLGEGGVLITLGGAAFISSYTLGYTGETAESKSSDVWFFDAALSSTAGVSCSSIGTSLILTDGVNASEATNQVQNLDVTSQYIQSLSEDELKQLNESLTEFIEFDNEEINREVRRNAKVKTL